MEQPATPNPAAGAAEKNHKKLQKSGSSAEGEVAAVAAEETSDGAADPSNSIQAAVNNEVWCPDPTRMTTQSRLSHVPLNRVHTYIRILCQILLTYWFTTVKCSDPEIANGLL